MASLTEEEGKESLLRLSGNKVQGGTREKRCRF
jgi:hypothetical protein